MKAAPTIVPRAYKRCVSAVAEASLASKVKDAVANARPLAVQPRLTPMRGCLGVSPEVRRHRPACDLDPFCYLERGHEGDCDPDHYDSESEAFL